MKKVVHLSSAHGPFDTRIFYKQCCTLATRGYDVTLVVPCGLDEEVDGVRIKGVLKRRTRLQRIMRTPWDIWRAARKMDAKIYHFHDPELIPVGFLLKLAKKIVVYDVHENLPEQVMVKSYIRYKVVRRVIARLAAILESLAGLAFDGFSVAAPSIHRRFPPDKTVLVRNFVRLQFVDSVQARERGDRDKFVVIYPGCLGEARGIRNLIESMSHLHGAAELWLMGRWQGNDFREKCENTNGWAHTKYFGEKMLGEVISLIKSADAGAHIPFSVPNYSDGLAVKGFEFMACSLPFVTTDEPGKRKTFGDCALFADAQDPADIALKISRLMEDGELGIGLGRRGRSHVEREFSWERESETLIGLYDRLMPDDRSTLVGGNTVI